MSTVFRTPLIDPVRNFVASWLYSEGPLFSLRRHRSFLKTYFTFTRLRRKGEHEKLVELIGVLHPTVIGRGWWFRFWSTRLKLKISSLIPKPELINSAPMADPLQVMFPKEYIELSKSQANFSRVLGSIFFKFPKVYLTVPEARGLERFKNRLECHTPWNWKKFEIKCDHNGRDFSTYLTNRESRELVLSSFHNTFNKSDEFHQAILTLLQERQKFAKSVGNFKSWTSMQYAMNGGIDGTSILNRMYQDGKTSVKSKISKLKQNYIDTTDEAFLLANSSGNQIKSDTAKYEYKRVLSETMHEFAKMFSVQIQPVPTDTSTGWHSNVLIYKVGAHGYIYLDLFRRPFSILAGTGPHCTMLGENHVRISMGLLPPYRSEITFQKERFFTPEETTALWHELGHAMHVLLRPAESPISQLPLDMRERCSVLCEMKYISNNPSIRLNFFYLDIIRNIAVSDFLHSEHFDPFTATIDDLKRESRRVFAQFTLLGPLASWCNPLAGELSNYILDGESRTGYLLAYYRAATILKSENCFENFKMDFIDKKFKPIVYKAFQPDGVSKSIPAITKDLWSISKAG